MMESYECASELRRGAQEHEGTITLKNQISGIPILTAILGIAISGVNTSAQQATAEQHAKAPQLVVSQNAAAERIINLDVLKNKVKQYHDCKCTCGCYEHDLDTQADRTIAYLRKRTARKRANEKLAMVLDIDETALSNYEELLGSGFNYIQRDWDAWIDTAKAPAIPGTLRLYKEAQKLGVAIFFIPGRPESQRAVTERNLSAQGYTNWQRLVLRPAAAASQSTTVYKSSKRAQIVGEGDKLVLNVGDQWSDLKGTPQAELSVKYPDPYYLIP
jgi:acid phosphatase